MDDDWTANGKTNENKTIGTLLETIGTRLGNDWTTIAKRLDNDWNAIIFGGREGAFGKLLEQKQQLGNDWKMIGTILENYRTRLENDWKTRGKLWGNN